MGKSYKEKVKGYSRGRGKYGISVTSGGKRGLGKYTFRTKEHATKYLKHFKSLQDQGKWKNLKNPRIVTLK